MRVPTPHSRYWMLVVLITCVLTMLAPAASLAAPARSDIAPGSVGIDPPEVTAKGVFSFDLTTGVTLYSKDPDARMQVGSTVKVATALVVVKVGNLEDQVKIEDSDIVGEEFSRMELVSGDTLTVSSLLYGLMIPSGNDAAMALSRHVGMQICECTNADDARSAFVQEMNTYARDLGLKDTQFVNPVGTDHKQAYSSAHDIAILFGELMKNERLASIAGERAYQLNSVGPERRQYAKDTTNRLLGQSGVIAGKTGSTGEAGGCVVFARQVESGNIVITAVVGADLTYEGDFIVDGSDKRWEDAQTIMTSMDTDFSWITPGSEGSFQGLAEEMAVWGVEFRDPPAIPYPGDGVETTYQLVLAPEGEEGGLVELFYDKNNVGSVPIYYASASSRRDRM